ncbi:UNVERIFIED_CONTAM: hypothetical protein Sradi_5711200, partial [Sesamum radiatum]
TSVPSQFDVTCTSSIPCNPMIWHNRLGYASMQAIKHILAVDYSDDASLTPCDICHRAKQCRNPFPISSSHSLAAFDLVHMDLWGPYTAHSISGGTYILTLLDDFSRCLWTFLIKQKSQVPSTLKTFCVMIQNQFNYTIKTLRSDNGTEFINYECQALCSGFGIIH